MSNKIDEYTTDYDKLYEVMKDGTWYSLVQLRKLSGVVNPHKKMSKMRERGFIVETFRKNHVMYYKLIHASIPIVDDTIQYPDIKLVRSEKRNAEMLIEQMNCIRMLAKECSNRKIEQTAERAMLAAGVSLDD